MIEEILVIVEIHLKGEINDQRPKINLTDTDTTLNPPSSSGGGTGISPKS